MDGFYAFVTHPTIPAFVIGCLTGSFLTIALSLRSRRNQSLRKLFG